MLIESIISGSKKVLETTKGFLKDKEDNIKVGYPGTNYNLPIIYGLLGRKIESVKDLKELINSLEIKEEPTLENALEDGVITLICAEAIESLKYALEKEPYKPPYTGFIPDEVLRDSIDSAHIRVITPSSRAFSNVGSSLISKEFINSFRSLTLSIFLPKRP